MTQGKQLATFKIDPAMWEGFKTWTITNNSNAAEALRWFIGECLDGRVSLPSGDEAAQRSIEGLDQRIDARIDERLTPILEELAEIRRVQPIATPPESPQPIAPPQSEPERLGRAEAYDLAVQRGCSLSLNRFRMLDGDRLAEWDIGKVGGDRVGGYGSRNYFDLRSR